MSSSQCLLQPSTSTVSDELSRRLTFTEFIPYFTKDPEDDEGEDEGGDEDDDDQDDIISHDQDPNAIGIAFSREQKRLTLPSTPAAEKVAALRRGSESAILARDEGRRSDTAYESSPETSERPSLEKSRVETARTAGWTTSSWQPELITEAQIDGAEYRKSSSSSIDRLRAWTGLSDAGKDQKGSRRIFQLPPLARFSLFGEAQTSPGLLWAPPIDMMKEDGSQNSNPSPSQLTTQPYPSTNSSFDSATSLEPSSARPSGHKNSDCDFQGDSMPQSQPLISQDRQPRPGFYSAPTSSTRRRTPSAEDGLRPFDPGQLNAQVSRGSTVEYNLERSLSITSSLGDDSRWVDVHEQINARFKAIRDSFIDSNIKFPRPRLPSLSALNFGAPWHHHEQEVEAKPSKQYWEDQWDTSLPPKIHRSVSDFPKVTADFSSTNAEGPTFSLPLPEMPKTSAAKLPNFVQAVKNLTGDVVILGGYRGSILRSADPGHRQLWVPIKVGLNLRKVNLEVGYSPEDEENMGQTIIPGGMLSHIGPVDISRRLFKRLRASRNVAEGTLRVWNYGYDWRLSPHRLSQQLIAFLEGLPCNSPDTPAEQQGALVMAHSLGGLITRHAINQRPELFSGVLYAGVPQRCVNILGPLRNGDDVLFSSRVLTAQVNFSIRTSFALLPLDGICFLNRYTKERYDIDFFDPNTWDEYRLSPCVARPVLLPLPSTPTFKIGFVGAMASRLPNLVRSGSSMSIPKSRSGTSTPVRSNSPPLKPESANASPISRATNTVEGVLEPGSMTPQMGSNTEKSLNPETNVATAVTITKEEAMTYLHRVLPEVKKFKQELAHNPDLAKKGLYPPAGIIYGKSVPTVFGAHVRSREAIKHVDAYDDLAFASGDGVVLATAAQIPDGFEVARGGRVSSDRGHLSLLGDLEAVGKALNAIIAERDKRRRSHL